jgi:hypothetical protein
MSRGGMPSRNKKNFRSTEAGAGMTLLVSKLTVE